MKCEAVPGRNHIAKKEETKKKKKLNNNVKTEIKSQQINTKRRNTHTHTHKDKYLLNSVPALGLSLKCIICSFILVIDTRCG